VAGRAMSSVQPAALGRRAGAADYGADAGGLSYSGTQGWTFPAVPS
jgi:hypothetical protein